MFISPTARARLRTFAFDDLKSGTKTDVANGGLDRGLVRTGTVLRTNGVKFCFFARHCCGDYITREFLCKKFEIRRTNVIKPACDIFRAAIVAI
jgi:hypothetical protein